MLNQKQSQASELVKQGKNILITGGAGTGKSFLIDQLKKANPKLAVTATTGIAAVNIGGVTINSFLGLGLCDKPANTIVHNLLRFQPEKSKKIREAHGIIIDEISMMGGETLDLIDDVLRDFGDSKKPFGGKQIILVGDFFQLPPVTKDNKPVFVFESIAYGFGCFENVILTEVFRQKDESFASMLNELREGRINDIDNNTFKSRPFEKHGKGIAPVKIVTHNSQADTINAHEISKLKGQAYSYYMSSKGNDKIVNELRKNCLAPHELELKEGAQVMMLKNTYQNRGIVNGSTGTVIGFEVPEGKRNLYPIVMFDNEKQLTVGYEGWEVFNEDRVLEGGIYQVPLRLAYAITVHKSQGMTLDKIECDMTGAFAEGQIYVGISRVKSLDGLYLKGFDKKKIKINPKVANFYKQLTNTIGKE